MIKDELFIKFKANESESTYGFQKSSEQAIGFHGLLKVSSQWVTDAFICLLHMRNQWLNGKKITCQFPERTDVDKQATLLHTLGQPGLITHVLDSCLLLELEDFIQNIFFGLVSIQSGGREGRKETR